MDKRQFLNFYRNPANTYINVHFYDHEFISNSDIKVNVKIYKLSDMLDFYVPRFQKNKRLDQRAIEEKEMDPLTYLLRLRKVRENPKKWDLQKTGDLPKREDLFPIPIAKDFASHKTLILDSNHLLANFPIDHPPLLVAEITGNNLEKIVRDFKILNR
jgi:hypothetical protein